MVLRREPYHKHFIKPPAQEAPKVEEKPMEVSKEELPHSLPAFPDEDSPKN